MCDQAKVRNHSILRWGYILCGLFSLGAFSVHAESTGPLLPDSAAGSTVSGNGGSWTPVGSLLSDVVTSDDVEVSVTEATAGTFTYGLELTFPISIPASATLDGVEFNIESHGGSGATLPGLLVYLSTNGGASYAHIPNTTGTFIATSATSHPDSIETWGSPTDLFLPALNTAAVNASTFKMIILATDFSGDATSSYFVDYVTCEVFYTPGTYGSTGAGGDWSIGSTWDSGFKPTTIENAEIASDSPVQVTGSEQCFGLEVNDRLTINSGSVVVTGTNSSVTAGVSDIGELANYSVFDTGTADLDLGVAVPAAYIGYPGSSVLIGGDANIGAGHYGIVTVEGSASFNATGDLNVGVGSQGVLDINPTANGAAGIGGIVCDNVTVGANSSLQFSTDYYTPSPGDSWDIITYSGSATGTFDLIEISGPGSAGLGIEVSSAKAGVVTVTVVFTGAGLPGTTNWGLVALLSTLAFVGILAVYGVRKQLYT